MVRRYTAVETISGHLEVEIKLSAAKELECQIPIDIIMHG